MKNKRIEYVNTMNVVELVPRIIEDSWNFNIKEVRYKMHTRILREYIEFIDEQPLDVKYCLYNFRTTQGIDTHHDSTIYRLSVDIGEELNFEVEEEFHGIDSLTFVITDEHIDEALKYYHRKYNNVQRTIKSEEGLHFIDVSPWEKKK